MYETISPLEAIKKVGSSYGGISDEQAAERLKRYGANKLVSKGKQSIIKRLFNELRNPMTLILIVSAVVSGIVSFIGSEFPSDVIIIMFVVVTNAVLGVVQESKAEKAIESLKEISSPHSKVIRNGVVKIIKSEEVVYGDVVIFEAGYAVPADCRIIESNSLRIEESALTGESVPAEKSTSLVKNAKLGDKTNMAFCGTMVVYGSGKGVVVATGMNTEMGAIAKELDLAKENKTPLQKRLDELSKTLTFVVLAICLVIFLVTLIKNKSFSPKTILDTFMIAISLAVAAIPEGLASVFTIVLSIGVTNMAKHNAVIRKLTAVETLGCAQIICCDKTGTLTKNKMTVVETYGGADLLLSMAMCNDVSVQGNYNGEPTELALVEYAAKKQYDKRNLIQRYPQLGEMPFDSERKMMSVSLDCNGAPLQITKGAPDEILKRCKYNVSEGVKMETDEVTLRRLQRVYKQMASKALRVLAFAMNRRADGKIAEDEMCFVGFAGMIDPVRPEVAASIAECKRAGIKVVMITGDHKQTATAIAKGIGILTNESQAIDGAELDSLSDGQLAKQINSLTVFARVQPSDKMRIVKAFQSEGMVVAMTGDGINDATAIKAADIGVAMGDGSDVAKGASDMVLTDDNFVSIKDAVKEGRRVYDNVRKAIQFLLASNLSEVLCIFIAMILSVPFLKPAHLLWINLITDCFPALALGLEPCEEDIMDRPPRSHTKGLFSDGMGVDIVFQGIVVTALTIASYYLGSDGTTMAFLTLSMCEIFHSFNMRSQKSAFGLKHNKYIWLSMAASVLCTSAVLYVPFLAGAFEFTALSSGDYLVAMCLAVTVLPIVELSKIIKRFFISSRKNEQTYKRFDFKRAKGA